MNDQVDSIDAGSSLLLAKGRTHGITAIPENGAPNRVGYLPKPANSPKPPKKDDEERDDGYFRRNRSALVVGTILAIGAVWGFAKMPAGDSSPVKKKPEKMVLKIVPLPPPPPPPPPKTLPPPPKVEKKVVAAPVEKPADKKPADEPSKGLGTSIKGSGPGMGLGSGRGLNGVIGGTGNGNGNPRLASLYAGKVGSRIEQNLRTNRKTRAATISVNANVWLDASGRITKASLEGDVGDAALRETISNEILTGQLAEPPPPGMKMPIKLRLNARRPSK